MTDFRIWSVIIALSILTFFLRSSFLVFMGNRQIPDSVRRYLRYVAVAIIPGMIAGLVSFPASLDGQTNIAWIGATLMAVLTGLRTKNMLLIMFAGVASFIVLNALF